jgi:hypothetical protein
LALDFLWWALSAKSSLIGFNGIIAGLLGWQATYWHCGPSLLRRSVI